MTATLRRLSIAAGAALAVAAVPMLSGAVATLGAQQTRQPAPRIEVTLPASLEGKPLDGRLLLVIAKTNQREPRFQVNWGLTAQPLFGLDVDGWKPGQAAVFDSSTRGWPVESLSGIPAGTYWVQAVLNVYTTFTRSDGHTVKAHMDQWEGQQWNRSPGNLISEPQEVRFDPASNEPVRLTLSKRLPPVDPPKDTRYVKHIKFRSDLLSRWWGHDIFLGAVVVLPEGFDDHPDARYPVVYNHGHFPATFNGFREDPPPAGLTGQARAQAEAQHRFFKDWVSGRLGRFLLVLMQHPTPFYDDSYAVNSANNGPYGDALTQELMPRVERQFRAVGEPWARTLTGGSTGGWESLAWQVLYPDLFNGVWTFCPDPVDFRYFQLVNIYQDRNAFYPNSDWKTEPVRPWQRTTDDQVLMSQKDASHLEAVLGTRGRSGQQMDIFMATFGPVGPDGYPKLLYDKWTGEIDRSVAEYWRDRYDLSHVIQRDWKTLGPKLTGKLHIYMGDTDTFFLEEATFKLREFLEGATDPPFEGTFDIGPRAPHCYSGAAEFPGQNSLQRVLPQMQERILSTAPAGGDVKSWRY